MIHRDEFGFEVPPPGSGFTSSGTCCRCGTRSAQDMGAELRGVVDKLRHSVSSGEWSAVVKPAECALVLEALGL